ncbi:MAG: IPT/TIG domain-containing protein, partial [Muribaculaceae bacterium]|nr:IPT/TIG domain-containing protein [Muribaculaceae bacterium]
MKISRLYILLAAIFSAVALCQLTSCSDDDSSTGAPVIECVRLTDPELADSTFTDGRLGQMILIQGRNLNNTLHVYINDQDCYFNSNYNTSTHLIVTIPADLVVRGVDDSLPLEIRIETTHGTTSYPFHVIAGMPVIEAYEADLALNADGIPEMVPGQEVTLMGSLIHEVQRVYVAELYTLLIAEVV